jgi:hypothetical protein
MISEWMAYLQYELGAVPDATGKLDAYTSWSAQLLGSLRWWMLLEGTHVLTMAVFAGSILFVDLRLLGLALPNVPISRVTRGLLPVTVGAFAVMVVTGLLVFYSKPFDYYHNFAFRAKVLFLIAAAVNIFVFHGRVQANQAAWDDAPKPPLAARRSAAFSLLLWVLVIAGGRAMAYDRFTCAEAGPVIGALADCQTHHATLDAISKEVSL